MRSINLKKITKGVKQELKSKILFFDQIKMLKRQHLNI